MEFLCCRVAFLDFSVGVGAFVIGLSLISFFFSFLSCVKYVPTEIVIHSVCKLCNTT